MTLEHICSKKRIEGPVRITLSKYIKVGEYIMAAISPHWNRVMGSPEDLDTLAPAITNHVYYEGDENYS